MTSTFRVALLLLALLLPAIAAAEYRATTCTCKDNGQPLEYDPDIPWVLQMTTWSMSDREWCAQDCIRDCGCAIGDGPCAYACLVGEDAAQQPGSSPAPSGENRPPQVLALNVTPSSPIVGESVRLRAFGEDPDGDPLRWIWSVNGERKPIDVPELSLGQPAGGEYAVRVVADDGRGGLAESELRFKVFQKTWCDEAGYFYDEATLQAFYTGAASLTLERQTLIDGFVQALRDFRAGGGSPVAGVQNRDTLTIAQSFDSGALPTGREAAIQRTATARAAALGRGLTPPELFAIALTETGGNVREALVASHAATYRDGPAVNATFIKDHLMPLRDARGYSQERAVKVWNEQRKEWQFVAAAETASADQQGVWYHLYGMAALEFADRHSYTPFWLIRQGAEHYKPQHALPLKERGVPSSSLCGQLSNYAIALENQVRSGMRRAPDPDKQCINYTGAAIGAALARELGLPTTATATPVPAPKTAPGAPTGSYLVKSPLSMELSGVNGEQVGFDQLTQRFYGNTPLAVLDFDEEPDGTMAVVISPLFEVRELTLTGTAAGPAQFGAADLDAEFSRVWELPVTPGARFRYEPAYALTDAAGTIVEHAAELHHSRQWAFPQAPMLIIAVTSGFGLLLGLIWIWRRGPFAPPPPLPPGSGSHDDGPRYCAGCGAQTRPGARFCRQCGRKLR
jgi:hypothetical protein